MGYFSDDSEQAIAWNAINDPHETEWSDELIGDAAAYQAANKYEEHVAANGKPASQAQAKEILRALAGASVDRIVETKGLDFIDTQKAKYLANKQTVEIIADDY
ncbi:Protein of unknown function DUF3759 [Aspergillus parasiticus SU-1]|uniref:Uncharacterized protein n=1 Tax=Aspergillus parasiticus (strain ATCC 56775 / NRRL 5862 / SRRC 143 / SU-1) TaxID=1403190 RepID=A0A0F0II08_ASPPU|nr:Protein of unknown function DUF3759 [Aspergillus parasiticus SU-1]